MLVKLLSHFQFSFMACLYTKEVGAVQSDSTNRACKLRKRGCQFQRFQEMPKRSDDVIQKFPPPSLH